VRVPKTAASPGQRKARPQKRKSDETLETHARIVTELHKARILVVEDHVFVRQAIAALINRQPDLVCCGEDDSIASTPITSGKLKPDLVLMDMRLKDGEALELIAALKFQFPQLVILVLSQCDETIYAEKALRAGASGYLMKEEAAGEVLDAIRMVLSGKKYLSRAMDRLLFHNRPPPTPSAENLVGRAPSSGDQEGRGGDVAC
jgi:DNA-binding NarL/FixJ family response regulator